MVIISCIVLTVCIIGTFIASNYFYQLAISPSSNKKIVDSGNVVTDVEANRSENYNYKKWLLQESGYFEFYLTSYDGLQLHNYQINAKSKSDKYAIVVHGYNSSAKNMGFLAKYFYDRGYHVILPDLRGHGESQGDYIGMGWHDRFDLMALIEYVVSQEKEARIVLAGVSMGAGAVLMTSGEELSENVVAVIEDSSYTSVWEEFSYELSHLFHLPEFPILPVTSLLTKHRAGYEFKEADVIKQVRKSKTPTLFIHGDSDTFVPSYMVQQLYDACTAERDLMIVKGAGHCQSFVIAPAVYKVKLNGFLNKYGM